MTDRDFNKGLQLYLWRCELQYRLENAPNGSVVDWLAPHCDSVQEIASFLRELGFKIKDISDYTDCAGVKHSWVITTGGLIIYENNSVFQGFVAMSAGERERRARKAGRSV